MDVDFVSDSFKLLALINTHVICK